MTSSVAGAVVCVCDIARIVAHSIGALQTAPRLSL
jgi:hypothetical protein